MTQIPRPTTSSEQTPCACRCHVFVQGIEKAPERPAAARPGVSNEVRAELVHALMQQVWDSMLGRRELDTLAVSHGILRNTELLDKIAAYRAADITEEPTE